MKKMCLILAVILAAALCFTACAQQELPEPVYQEVPAEEPAEEAEAESEEEPAEEAEEAPAEEAEAEEEPAEEADAAAAPPADITPVETAIDSPAKIGDWVETKRYAPETEEYCTVYYRVTNVVRGEEAQAAVDAYNAEDHVVLLSDLESDDLEYCMVEYEVYFPADFPQADYGITQTDIDFSVQSPDGGGIEANGLSYIGLSSVWDISKTPEIDEFFAGDTFTEGKAVFAMVKGVSDYVFEVTYYDDDDNAVSSYVEGL